MLPICLGEATKFSQFLLDSDKHYLSTFTLGVSTETGDSEGAILNEQDASAITEQQIEAAIADFRGDIKQIPSMYSALKHNGQPLYKLARQGIEIEREARDITVFSYQILAYRPGPQAQLDVQLHVVKVPMYAALQKTWVRRWVAVPMSVHCVAILPARFPTAK